MTIALCFVCGEYKVGAFTPCLACGAEPETDDDLAHSLALTDHYLTPEGLAQVQQQALSGQPITIDPDFYEQLLQGLREERDARGGSFGKVVLLNTSSGGPLVANRSLLPIKPPAGLSALNSWRLLPTGRCDAATPPLILIAAGPTLTSYYPPRRHPTSPRC